MVEFDGFKHTPDSAALMHETEIVNVVATLAGRQPGAAERVYVVSGHYDSRSLNVLMADLMRPAPTTTRRHGGRDGTGAGDVALRSCHARFMTVAAEEQGLLVQTWAERAAKNKVTSRDAQQRHHRQFPPGRWRVDDRTCVFSRGGAAGAAVSAEVLSQIRTGGETIFPTVSWRRAVREIAGLTCRNWRCSSCTAAIGFCAPEIIGLSWKTVSRPCAHGGRTRTITRARGSAAGRRRAVRRPAAVCRFAMSPNVARVNAAALATLARAPATPMQVEARLSGWKTTRCYAGRQLRSRLGGLPHRLA